MRHGIGVCGFVLAAGFLLDGDLSAGSLEPPGPPAPTMKTLGEAEPRTPISSLPVTIAAQGSYYLTGDLIGVSGQAGITITASHVTLDLNGFSLIGVPGSFSGINASDSGVRHLAIKNGVIRSWALSGVIASGAVHAENLRLDLNTFTGLSAGPTSIVRNTTATQNGTNGITVGVNSAIIGCTASGNAATGLTAGANSVVSSSAAVSNGTGITLGQTSTATDCSALQNGTGFSLQIGSRVVHSTARGNVNGILGAEGVAIEGCTVEGNSDDGMRFTSHALVRGNLARSNTNDGIHALGDRNRIEENQSYMNLGGGGIHVDGGNNLVVRNNAGLNGTEYMILGSPNQVGPITNNPGTAGPWSNFDQ